MTYLRDCRRIVIKVGTSTLTHATGHLNLRRIQSLVKTISDMKNSGIEMVLVSSGAVAAGAASLSTAGAAEPAAAVCALEEQPAIMLVNMSAVSSRETIFLTFFIINPHFNRIHQNKSYSALS